MNDDGDDGSGTQALGDELLGRCRDGAASTGDVLVKMSIAMFEPPFSRLIRPEVLPKLSEPLKTMLAILLLDTDLVMSGFTVLIGNSPGAIIEDILAALERIGEHDDARRARRTLAYLESQGITPHTLQYGDAEQDHDDDDLAAIWAKAEELSNGICHDHSAALIAWVGARWKAS